jgi:hypothetical protein
MDEDGQIGPNLLNISFVSKKYIEMGPTGRK